MAVYVFLLQFKRSKTLFFSHFSTRNKINAMYSGAQDSRSVEYFHVYVREIAANAGESGTERYASVVYLHRFSVPHFHFCSHSHGLQLPENHPRSYFVGKGSLYAAVQHAYPALRIPCGLPLGDDFFAIFVKFHLQPVLIVRAAAETIVIGMVQPSILYFFHGSYSPLSFNTFHIYGTERACRAEIFACSATYAAFLVYHREFRGVRVIGKLRDHLYGTGRTMSCAIAAGNTFGHGEAVFGNPDGSTGLY